MPEPKTYKQETLLTLLNRPSASIVTQLDYHQNPLPKLTSCHLQRKTETQTSPPLNSTPCTQKQKKTKRENHFREYRKHKPQPTDQGEKIPTSF